jgi:dUTP pyrophosphatase
MPEQETDEPTLALERLAHGSDLPLPAYQTEGSAGLDLVAAVGEPMTLAPGERGLVPTGLKMAIPVGHEAQIRPRSGLALKHGLTIPNSPGTIDSDYRGEVKVILQNGGQEPFVIERGMRVAQMVIAPVTRVALTVVERVDDTVRGEGGFGHTGA